MPSFIRNPKDFWTGIMFLAFGLFAVYIAREYSMGSAAKMGPGYFPTVLGYILAAIGAIGIVRSFITHGEAIGRFAIRELILILVGVLLFGFLIRTAGLIVAILVMMMMAAYASVKFKLRTAILLAVGATTFSVLVFVKLLGLPIPIIGPWFGV